VVISRFLDPLGVIAATWNWTSTHGGGGLAALVLTAVVLLLHLVVLGVVFALVFNTRASIETIRGFRQGASSSIPGQRSTGAEAGSHEWWSEL
jgi:Na+/H+-dicarboxylate symporter